MTRLFGRIRRFRRAFVLLAVIGPGLITSNADNDAGGIATYSQAGAQFGYQMLWILVAVTVSLAVVNEMGARMGVVTGKGLADLIRERFGVRRTTFAMALLLFANAFTTVAEFAGIAAGLELFGVPRFVSVPAAAAVIWLLVVRGSYPVVEKVLLSITVVYVTYVISGFLAHPPWPEVLRSSVVPHVVPRRDFVLLAIALIGTTVTPWMQFYLQAAVADKGIPNEHLAYSQTEVVAGAFVTDFVDFFIIIATAAALFGHLSSAQLGSMQAGDFARALEPAAGQAATALFAVGLVGASVLAGSVVPLSTAYAVTEAFGWERGVGRDLGEAPAFFGIFTGLLAIGTAAVMIPGLPLVTLILLSQEANGIILPAILIFMLVLLNDRRIMGRHVNGRLANTVAGLTVAVLIGLTLILLVASLPGSPLSG
ncbi:MAG TPA: Nramp family divalent metal transporter [Candidatus Dormibacteraeota bacterium]|nr:Nramp family divalent metal transporter [Candidatus Dormibacteraeota bacterium]